MYILISVIIWAIKFSQQVFASRHFNKQNCFIFCLLNAIFDRTHSHARARAHLNSVRTARICLPPCSDNAEAMCVSAHAQSARRPQCARKKKRVRPLNAAHSAADAVERVYKGGERARCRSIVPSVRSLACSSVSVFLFCLSLRATAFFRRLFYLRPLALSFFRVNSFCSKFSRCPPRKFAAVWGVFLFENIVSCAFAFLTWSALSNFGCKFYDVNGERQSSFYAWIIFEQIATIVFELQKLVAL